MEYVPPSEPLFTADEYDLLIITHDKFEEQLQRLVDHKNNIGVRTIMETTADIYPQYNGRDEAEDIKLRIKDAIEEWGISYVLLAGGRMGQTHQWYVPDRRSNNRDGSDEDGYSSDLYFADIYEENGGFSSWDTNGNGVYAEFSRYGVGSKDIIDYYPDVYVGRLPLRYSWEADVIADKIINYELYASPGWFKKAFVIAGDTSPPARDEHGYVIRGIYEGELSTDMTVKVLKREGFTVEKLWTSEGTFTGRDDVIEAVNSGSGFIHFAGHGSPGVWGNFLPDAEKEPEEFVYGLGLIDMRKFSNGVQLPVVAIGGCHNAQFNVSLQYLIEGLHRFEEDFFNHRWFYMLWWVPTDMCSWFVLEGGGGAVASIGNTGYGYGYINQACTMGLGGWINPRFFHAYATQNKEILGEAHGQAVTDYINQRGALIEDVNIDSVDRKTIEQWALIGDPSLKIGGA
jgi:hypothetical protein